MENFTNLGMTEIAIVAIMALLQSLPSWHYYLSVSSGLGSESQTIYQKKNLIT